MRFPLLGGSLLAGGGIAQALFGFGANLILVRYLSPADFGSYAVTLAIISTTFAVASLRLSAFIIRDSTLDVLPQRGRLYSGALLLETAFATTLAVVAVMAFDELTSVAMLLILTIAGSHVLGVARSFFERTMALPQIAVVEAGSSFASHLAAIVMILGGMGVLTLYLRDLIALVLGAIGLWVAGGRMPRPRMLTLEECKTLLRSGRGLWLDGVLEGLFQRLTVLLSAVLGGASGAGFFFQAQRLASVPQQILFPLVGRAGMVWLSRMDDAQMRRSGRDRLLLMTGSVLAVAGAATIAFADPVVPLLFGEDWRPTALLLVWLSGFVVFGTLFEIVKVFCMAVSQTRTLLMGRVAQYAAGAVVLAAWLTAGGDSMVALACAVSACSACAVVTMLALLLRMERRPVVVASR